MTGIKIEIPKSASKELVEEIQKLQKEYDEELAMLNEKLYSGMEVICKKYHLTLKR